MPGRTANMSESTETPVEHANHEQLTRTRSRFTIAADALRGDKPFAVDACQQYFSTLNETLASLRIERQQPGFVDEHVLASLELSRPLRDDFLALAALIVASKTPDSPFDGIVRFLGGMLVYRQAPRGVERYNPLWSDPYTFLAREWFTNLCAIALAAGREDFVATLLQADYGDSTRRSAAAGFLSFGGYVRSLDEFRARRTGVAEPLPSAELMRERCAHGPIGFEQVMQADLLICLHSLFAASDCPRYWLPVTLVCAGPQAVDGFPLFRAIAGGGSPNAVLTAVGMKKWRQFVAAFESAFDSARLDRWRLADAPVPFRRFLALGAA